MPWTKLTRIDNMIDISRMTIKSSIIVKPARVDGRSIFMVTVLSPLVYSLGPHVFKNSLGNFHEDRPTGTAFKLRYALKGTSLYGGYMTDIIKGLHETDSTKVKQYLKKNPEILKKNVDSFCQELEDLEVKNPLLIALGNDVYDILSKNLQDYKILKIPHYSSRNLNSKEEYREKVLECISCIMEEKK